MPELGGYFIESEGKVYLSTATGQIEVGDAAGRKWALIAERAINWMFNRLTGETDHCRNAARRHHGSRS